MVGLKNDLALFSCPARSSGDTGIKLSETLCGAEISGKQRPVDIQQGDEGDVREVMPFGQHLGANQNTRPAAMDGGEMLLQRSFAAGGIAVDTRDRHLREQRCGACSSCSVPIPTGTRCVEPQEGHWRGIGRWLSQWWQRRWCCARCNV